MSIAAFDIEYLPSHDSCYTEFPSSSTTQEIMKLGEELKSKNTSEIITLGALNTKDCFVETGPGADIIRIVQSPQVYLAINPNHTSTYMRGRVLDCKEVNVD